MFHELTTNAVKYGALSVPSGRIEVRRVGGNDEALTIEWQEHDGPPVTPPQSSGFGQTLISRSLGSGGAQLEFRPPGVVCRISIPRN